MTNIINMEKGLFQLCRKQVNDDPEFKKEFNIASDTAIDALVFEAFRLHKLKKTLRYAYSNSKYYRDLFDYKKIKPEDIQSIQDIGRFPLTTPNDLAAREFEFLCISQGEVDKIITFISSGTIGPKKRIFFTEKDLEIMTDFMGVGMNTVTGAHGIVQILLPSGPVMGQADLLARGVQKMGAESVYTGWSVPSEDQIKAIIDHRASVIFGETRLIYRITKEMEKKYDLSRLGIKTLFVTTSYLSDIMRQNLKASWNCDIVTHYGLTEMGLGLAVECPCGEGYHFDELDILAEAIDPETGMVLPDGEEGELVFTTISREGMPLIRYRTHDIARLTSQRCPCGCSLRTISHVKRRLESLVEVSPGVNIYPSLFDDILFLFPEVVDYDVCIDKRGNKRDILFEIELIEERKEIAQKIILQLQNIEIIATYFDEPKIKILPLGSLRGGVHFKKLIKVFE